MQSTEQRHTVRDRRPSTAACPACWAIGTKKLKKCKVREKYAVLGRLEKPRQNKKTLVPAQQAHRTNQRKGPFHLS
ncbi:MAG: hypothetical protein ACK55Z_10725, partial [bacterium]